MGPAPHTLEALGVPDSLGHLLGCSSWCVSPLPALLAGAEFSISTFMPPPLPIFSHPCFWCMLPCSGPSGELVSRAGMLKTCPQKGLDWYGIIGTGWDPATVSP